MTPRVAMLSSQCVMLEGQGGSGGKEHWNQAANGARSESIPTSCSKEHAWHPLWGSAAKAYGIGVCCYGVSWQAHPLC
jgi:hypothetical protein